MGVNVPSSGRISRPWRGKVEVANNFRPQQRDHVRADRKLEAWVDFFCDCGSAHDVAAFKHQHFLARFRQVGSIDEAVVACADDDHVIF